MDPDVTCTTGPDASAHVRLRPMTAADAEPVSAAFAAIGWDKPASQYTRYVQEAEAGTRVVLLAEVDAATGVDADEIDTEGDGADSARGKVGSVFAGYCTLVWDSDYEPFHEAGIPEVVDLNVLPDHRRHGIASALLDALEQQAAARSDVVGIGVGLLPDYGAAQRLYVHRGYVPDGRGIARNGRTVGHGEQIPIDDDVALMSTRRVR
jgi:GNAT superfamily N-acetyltransferase